MNNKHTPDYSRLTSHLGLMIPTTRVPNPGEDPRAHGSKSDSLILAETDPAQTLT